MWARPTRREGPVEPFHSAVWRPIRPGPLVHDVLQHGEHVRAARPTLVGSDPLDGNPVAGEGRLCTR
jgi:hypothetical protein